MNKKFYISLICIALLVISCNRKIGRTEKTAADIFEIDEKFENVPAHPNNFMISPAVEARMLPWFSAKYNLDGYLRWAYNSWPENVYGLPVYKYVEGDEYQVYPGPEGPVSSIRWELLKDGIEDYELIRTLREKYQGNDNDSLLQAIEIAVRNQDGREKDVNDIVKARDMIVRALSDQ
jgi:hypothetical protein